MHSDYELIYFSECPIPCELMNIDRDAISHEPLYIPQE